VLARIRTSIEDSDEGFTLIELLVVIIIIGILAAIAIPVFLNQRKKGYQASMKSDLRTVADEMETYYTDSGTYLGAYSSTGTVSGSASTGTLAAGTAGYVGSDGISLSSGNTIAIVNSGTVGYCLKASSTKSTGVFFFYDSTRGGLQPATTTTCGGTYS
jgi:type IV pilus assembly protein PilA